MCELLIRVTDRVNYDPTLNQQLSKRGDVIVIVENDHQWSQEEMTAPYWRILKAPLVSVAAANVFLERARNPDGSLRLRRASKVDIDSLTGQAQQWINDDTRAQPFYTFNVTEAQLLAMRVVKP